MRTAPANQTETRNHVENLGVVAHKLNIKAAFARAFLHHDTKRVELSPRKRPSVIFAHGMALPNRLNGNHAPAPFRRAASLSPFYATTHREAPRSIISSKSTSRGTRERIRRNARAFHEAGQQARHSEIPNQTAGRHQPETIPLPNQASSDRTRAPRPTSLP